MEQSAEWQAEQQRIQEEANRKRAEAAKQQENRANQYTVPEKSGVDNEVEVAAQPVRSSAKKHSDIGRKTKAAASRTNRERPEAPELDPGLDDWARAGE